MYHKSRDNVAKMQRVEKMQRDVAKMYREQRMLKKCTENAAKMCIEYSKNVHRIQQRRIDKLAKMYRDCSKNEQRMY